MVSPLAPDRPPPENPPIRPPPVRSAASRGPGPPAPVVAPPRMLARLRLLLLCVLVLAPLPVRAAGDDVRLGADALAAALDDRPAPTIEADPGPLEEGVRATERAELLTTLGQVLATDGTLPRTTGGIPAPAACRAAGWSDVVQCRRWSGAHLLRWATPPPPLA